MSWFLATLPFYNAPSVPTEAYKTLPQLIEPFVPAIVIMLVAIGVELAAYWSQRSTRISWWYPMALAAMSIFLVTWKAWSSGPTMIALADSPDVDGLQFRFQLIGFGIVAIGLPLWMIYSGTRQAIEEFALSGFGILLARLLPAPTATVLLLVWVRNALDVFSGFDFRVFY